MPDCRNRPARCPVARLDAGDGNLPEPGELHRDVMERLAAIQRRTGATGDAETASGRPGRQAGMLHGDADRRVVPLAEAYDNPVLAALGNSGLARTNRNCPRRFHGTAERRDAGPGFGFPTGVGGSVGTRMFSGMNNPMDIAPDPNSSGLCAIMEKAIRTRCSRRNPTAAMRRLRGRGLAGKGGSRGVPIHPVGTGFDFAERDVAAFETVQA